MKKRYLIILALIFGLCHFIVVNDGTGEINLSDIVYITTLSHIEPNTAYLGEMMKGFIPLMIFQIIYGAYIYQHFCSASVYYFSRSINRKKWFISESIKLLGISLMYVCTMLATVLLATIFNHSVIWDETATILILYYVAMYTLYLCVIALAINMISIRFGSSAGFVVVMSINIFFITLYALSQDIVDMLGGELENHLWLFKINPFAHLVFSTHSSSHASVDYIINIYNSNFDLNWTILLFLIVFIVLLIGGSILCERHEFIKNNIEE